jgi:hypothetical protein
MARPPFRRPIAGFDKFQHFHRQHEDRVMETATSSSALGVNIIVRTFFDTFVAENPEKIETAITRDGLVVFITGASPPSGTGPAETDWGTCASGEAVREQLFRKSDHVLRARVADFLRRPIRGMHYIFGGQTGDMSIVIYFEPLSVCEEGTYQQSSYVTDRRSRRVL